MAQKDVASDMLISLASSNTAAPNFWLNPQNGVTYSVYVQTPQSRVQSIEDLENTAVYPPSSNAEPQLLGNLAVIKHGASASNVTHYNIMRTTDLLMGVQGTDLGSAADKINQLLLSYRKKLPRGSTIVQIGRASCRE